MISLPRCFRPHPWLGALALFLALAALALAPQPAAAQQSKTESADGPFDPAEEQAIRQLVREYLLDNPEVIMEAVQILREREQKAADRSRQDALAAHAEALKDPGPLQVFGNPDGDVTVIEFFDYRCPYCRGVVADLMRTLEADGNVRLVLKEYPILGQDSVFAARAAIAAAMQGRYADFHTAMMTQLKEVNEASVLKLAEHMDLDVERLRTDMQSQTVNAELQRTQRLGQALQIGGTPAFIVGDTLVPGALRMTELQELIAQARESNG